MQPLMVLAFGLLLGMQHATEADHVAAVASIASGEQHAGCALRHGMAWGLGHTLTLAAVAAGVSLLGWVISPSMAGHFEQAVGLMLIALGLNLAWRLRREHYHVHHHDHGQGPHLHVHRHEQPAARAAIRAGTHAREQHRHGHGLPARTVLVGMVHGLAGSAALVLLVGQTMPSPAWMLAYVLIFGVGSMIGMAILSGAMGWSMRRASRRVAPLHRLLSGLVALVAVGIGLHQFLAFG